MQMTDDLRKRTRPGLTKLNLQVQPRVGHKNENHRHPEMSKLKDVSFVLVTEKEENMRKKFSIIIL